MRVCPQLPNRSLTAASIVGTHSSVPRVRKASSIIATSRCRCATRCGLVENRSWSAHSACPSTAPQRANCVSLPTVR
jgi:hypothetical protein